MSIGCLPGMRTVRSVPARASAVLIGNTAYNSLLSILPRGAVWGTPRFGAGRFGGDMFDAGILGVFLIRGNGVGIGGGVTVILVEDGISATACLNACAKVEIEG